MELAIPPMVLPSKGSTAVFVAIVVALAVAFVLAVRRASTGDGVDASVVGRRTAWATLGIAGWLGVTAGVTLSNVLQNDGFPPRVMLYLAGCNLTVAALALSRLGGWFARSLPIAALVGFQVFRLPLELVLHAWYEQGTLPIQMTYSGHNFDIVSGVLGGLLGLVLWRAKLGAAARWWVVAGYNLIGFGLLITVASIAVLSSPVPFRAYLNEPAVQLAFHWPYTWIVPICVAGALFGHIVVFRWLWAQRARGAVASA